MPDLREVIVKRVPRQALTEKAANEGGFRREHLDELYQAINSLRTAPTTPAKPVPSSSAMEGSATGVTAGLASW